MALVDLIDDLKRATKHNRKMDEAIAIFAGYKRLIEEVRKPDGQTEQKITWVPPGASNAIPLNETFLQRLFKRL